MNKTIVAIYVVCIIFSCVICVESLDIPGCYYPRSTSKDHILSTLDACITVCDDENINALCDYFQTNYKTSVPNVWICAVCVLLTIGTLVIGNCMSVPKRTVDIENTENDFAHVDDDTDGFNTFWCMIATQIIMICIIGMTIGAIYFEYAKKRSYYGDVNYRMGIIAYKSDINGINKYRFSPLFEFDHENGPTRYMRFAHKDWQQSERIMTRNLVDIDTAFDILTRNNLYTGVKNIASIEVDNNNVHNARGSMQKDPYYGADRIEQSRFSTGAWIFVIGLPIILAITIVVLLCIIE